MTKQPKILILYHQANFPLRSTVRDLLYCYKKYSHADCVYLNTFGRKKIPEIYFEQQYDLIIFHTVFISFRWGGESDYNKIKQLISPLINSKAIKIVLPQDEWIHTNLLNKFINEFNIDKVFSVAPPSEWPKIYNQVDKHKVSFHEVITGYIEDEIVSLIAKKEHKNRSIDIGYRAYKAPQWLGRHGFLKTNIAEVFNEKAPTLGFKTNISTEAKDTILGDQWYDFLLDCNYFIGLEGGSTVIDPDGDIWNKGLAFTKLHPDASFEEVEEAVFPGMDGNLGLIAISPRHLECCITKTCQVLMEGNYNGILKPNIHYINLKKDYSNLEEVFQKMKDEALRIKITEQAYQDIIVSKKYTYEQYVKNILSISIPQYEFSNISDMSDLNTHFSHLEDLYNQKLERKSRSIKKLSTIYQKTGLKKIVTKIKT